MLIYDQVRTMQCMQTAVARGFTRWAAGFVRFDRALALAEKFATLYHANPTPPIDMRLRRQGVARTKLFMAPAPQQLGFRWWLLISSGTGPVTVREVLRDATERDSRICVADFELVRIPRAGGAAWTWRIPIDEFETRLAYASAIAMHVDPTMAQSYVEHMRTWPGFSAIRTQRSAIWSAMTSARVRAGRVDALRIPTLQPWPRRLALQGHGTPLAILVERMRQSVAAPTGEQP